MMKYLNILILLIITTTVTYSQNNAPIIIKNNNVKLEWLYPKVEKKEIGKHQKLEFGLNLNSEISSKIQEFIASNQNGINPFNPEDISIEFTFISPSYVERKAFAFYYEPYTRSGETWVKANTEYNWRVRFAPDEIGNWSFTFKVIIQGKEIESVGSKFQCIKSTSKGVLRRNYNGDNTDRYLFLSEEQKPFFTIGHNICHSAYYQLTPQKAEQHLIWLTELAKSGGNFFRLEMGAQNGLPDWNDYKNYSSKMPQMWEYDQLLEHANQLDLYFIMFRHHTEVEEGASWDVSRWENNPYRKGFELKTREEYFTNEEVIKWQKYNLRYLFSRWGYNTSFAFYEYQEIDNWYKELKKEAGFNDAEAIKTVKDWYVKQRAYIEEELGYDKLFINTYASTPKFEYNGSNDGMFAHSDVIGIHKYGQNKEINYTEKYDKAINLFKEWKKPILVEEMGVSAGGDSEFLPLYVCSGIEFHNSIWATSFMGTAGNGLVWWWDRGIHDFEYYKDYQALSNFISSIDFKTNKFEPQKWHSKLTINRALIENYALKNEESTYLIGWVHNATNYWRNIESSCLKELQEYGYFKKPYQLEDGSVLGNQQDVKTDYLQDDDSYSKKGVQDVSNQTFEILGLKSTGLFSKGNWYKIVFYSTITGLKESEEVVKTNIWGKLKPHFPSTNLQDYAYKVEYLGEHKKEPK